MHVYFRFPVLPLPFLEDISNDRHDEDAAAPLTIRTSTRECRENAETRTCCFAQANIGPPCDKPFPLTSKRTEHNIYWPPNDWSLTASTIRFNHGKMQPRCGPLSC
ncbi:hypothetical protein MTO96_027209 [Rhipicephalus appendiculatus]